MAAPATTPRPAMPPAPGMTVPAGIPAIGYIRVSKAREEMISPELQKEAIRDWARRNGRVIVQWVEDLDASGRTWNRRIMGVIERVELGDAVEVVVWKYSRFGRDRTGCALNLGRLNACGGELQSATEDIDATTAVGKLSRGMLMEIAAFESDRAGEQWREAWAWRIEQGLPPLGGARFGYTRLGRIPNPLGTGTIRNPEETETYVPVADVAPVYARAFKEYVAGSGFLTAAKLFNRHGLRGTRGGVWYERSVAEVMGSGFAAGLIHIHDPDCKGPHRGTSKGECRNRIHLPGRHEAIIDIDLWEAFKERRARRAGLPRGTRAAAHLYTGVTWCGHCGTSMSGSAKPTFVEYRCSDYNARGACAPRSIRSTSLDPVVKGLLVRWADDIDTAAANARIAEEEAGEEPPESPTDPVAQAQAAVDEVDRKLDKLLSLHLDDKISEGEYRRRRDALMRERSPHSDVIDQTQEQAPAVEPVERVPVARTLLEEWPTLPAARRRELLQLVVARIEVRREHRQDVRATVRLFDGTEETFDLSYEYASHLRKPPAG